MTMKQPTMPTKMGQKTIKSMKGLGVFEKTMENVRISNGFPFAQKPLGINKYIELLN